MTDDERNRYIRIVKEKYIINRFYISCKFEDKKLAKKYYEEMKKYNINTMKSRINHIRMRSAIINLMYKGVKEIKTRYA